MRSPDIEAGLGQVIKPSRGDVRVDALLREKRVIPNWVLRLQFQKDWSNTLIEALLE